MKTYEIKEYLFEVHNFTAYESLMLASDLASIIGKVIGNYKTGDFLSIVSTLAEVEKDKLFKILKSVLSKATYKKLPIDLDSTAWSGRNLMVLFELAWSIIKDEYSDFLTESGLGELMEVAKEEIKDLETSTKSPSKK